MNRIRRFRKNRDATEQKFNKIKSTILKLSLIMLNFICATFAWFTYTMMLDPTVEVNLSAWQVDFKDTTGSLGTSMQFQVGEFYPGMTDYKKEIQIENLGDRAANITYHIGTLKILGQPYTIKQKSAEGNAEHTEYASETTEEENSEYIVYASETTDEETGMKIVKILNDSSKFPFEIVLTHTPEIGIENPENPNQNKGTFGICFTWPYEITGTEEEIEAKNNLDTQWGYSIANFYQTQQEGDNTQGIEIELQAVAEQII